MAAGLDPVRVAAAAVLLAAGGLGGGPAGLGVAALLAGGLYAAGLLTRAAPRRTIFLTVGRGMGEGQREGAADGIGAGRSQTSATRRSPVSTKKKKHLCSLCYLFIYTHALRRACVRACARVREAAHPLALFFCFLF